LTQRLRRRDASRTQPEEKHGAFSDEALALKKEIQALARMARQTIAAIE
jgi:hypothetical protein